MPEGVEVEIARREISYEFTGRHLTSYNFLKGKYYKKAPPLFQIFKYDLCRANEFDTPMVLVDVSRRGKLLSLEFQIGEGEDCITWWVCNHFGLHGMYRKNEQKLVPNYDIFEKEPHVSLEFSIDKKIKPEFLNFYDTSGFGTSFMFFNNPDKYVKFLNKLAIDIFDDEFTLEQFIENYEIIKKKGLKKFEICRILINQGYLCSGIGNYLKCEILYEAKLSPFRDLRDLNEEEIKRLYHSIKLVSERHLYANGKNQDLMEVYYKKEDSNGNKVVYEKTPDGKYTYWIPEIQK